MKTLLILSLAVIIGCQQVTPADTINADQELITVQDATNLLARWEQAMKDKDSTLLKQVLHPEYQYAGSPDGSTADRKTMMTYVATDPNDLLSQDFFDMDIKLYRDVAIVRGWEIMKVRSAEGDTSEFKLRFTDVYVKENDMTRALSTHSSPMD